MSLNKQNNKTTDQIVNSNQTPDNLSVTSPILPELPLLSPVRHSQLNSSPSRPKRLFSSFSINAMTLDARATHKARITKTSQKSTQKRPVSTTAIMNHFDFPDHPLATTLTFSVFGDTEFPDDDFPNTFPTGNLTYNSNSIVSILRFMHASISRFKFNGYWMRTMLQNSLAVLTKSCFWKKFNRFLENEVGNLVLCQASQEKTRSKRKGGS